MFKNHTHTATKKKKCKIFAVDKNDFIMTFSNKCSHGIKMPSTNYSWQ